MNLHRAQRGLAYDDESKCGGVAEREESLRQRIRPLNAQVDDLRCALRIPRVELLVCVNRLLDEARRHSR